MEDIKTGSITITGLAELEQRLLVLGEKIANQEIREGLKQGAIEMRDQAREFAPKSVNPHYLGKGEKKVLIQPGSLKKAINVKFDKNTSRKGVIRYEIFVKNKDRWYWKFVEFGTSKMFGRTYMRSAFEWKKNRVIEVVSNYLREAIKKGGR